MSVLNETYTLSNGVTIPKVGFGTWQIPNGDAAYDAVTTALKTGYTHIDTAYAYGNEESVGKAIKDSGIERDKVFVTSKLPGEIKDAEEARRHFVETLANLGTDYLDLYLIHAPWPWNRIGTRHDEGNLEVWKVLEEQYRAGRIRAIGVSNFDVHDLTNILDNAEVKPMVNQIQYYVGFTEPTIVDFSQKNGMLIEAYSPLATGDLLHNSQVQGMAAKYGVSVAQVALRFCLDNGVLPLPKATSEAHIVTNAELNFTIDPEDQEALRHLSDSAPEHFHNSTQG
ncbi:MAG: aldo/keto reductase [Bifidobacteriaceae bacterium]|jgi:diketogulonate reductase-like aldo/keto reductase|nr:aldo/keto reductase [Bifidobacteriaceae bacterium]MCI1914882.1 aldo/keto reductase [Bifidobacteriaceae bacterium]